MKNKSISDLLVTSDSIGKVAYGYKLTQNVIKDINQHPEDYSSDFKMKYITKAETIRLVFRILGIDEDFLTCDGEVA